MVTTGNHDMEAWYSPDGYGGQLARWSLPDNGPDPRTAPGVYSFTYGNVGVIALDANDVSYEIPANFGYSRRRADEVAGPAAGRAAGGEGHRLHRRLLPPLRLLDHHAHASDGGVRDEWVPLFEKHQVDLVINGHNHVYERTDAIRGGKVARKVPIGGATDPTRDGIVYVTAGGARPRPVRVPRRDGQLRGARQRPRLRATYHWTKGGARTRRPWSGRGCATPATRSSRWRSSRGAAGRALKVTALAETGERIDHFEVRRGRARAAPRRVRLPAWVPSRVVASVTGGAAVVPAVEGALEGGGGVLAVGLARAGDVTDRRRTVVSAMGNRLLLNPGVRRVGSPRRRKGRGAGAAGVACTGHRLTTASRWIERDVRLLQK